MSILYVAALLEGLEADLEGPDVSPGGPHVFQRVVGPPWCLALEAHREHEVGLRSQVERQVASDLCPAHVLGGHRGDGGCVSELWQLLANEFNGCRVPRNDDALHSISSGWR